MACGVLLRAGVQRVRSRRNLQDIYSGGPTMSVSSYSGASSAHALRGGQASFQRAGVWSGAVRALPKGRNIAWGWACGRAFWRLAWRWGGLRARGLFALPAALGFRPRPRPRLLAARGLRPGPGGSGSWPQHRPGGPGVLAARGRWRCVSAWQLEGGGGATFRGGLAVVLFEGRWGFAAARPAAPRRGARLELGWGRGAGLARPARPCER